MKILISNDDGVLAPGLAALAASLSSLAQITVVAPDRNRSAASNSLTIDRPLRVTRQENGFYAVTGTPTDAVHLAITGLLAEHPDMVVAGINPEANLGDDVLYSGTVAAATEGRFLGYPAIAISLVATTPSHALAVHHFDTAARVAKQIIEKLKQDPLANETILNINVPDRPFKDIKGFEITRLGHRHLAEKMVTQVDPRGEPIYWIGPAGKEQDAGPGTDFYAIKQGYVSITPIKVDLTDYQSMQSLSEWSKSIK